MRRLVELNKEDLITIISREFRVEPDKVSLQVSGDSNDIIVFVDESKVHSKINSVRNDLMEIRDEICVQSSDSISDQSNVEVKAPDKNSKRTADKIDKTGDTTVNTNELSCLKAVIKQNVSKVRQSISKDSKSKEEYENTLHESVYVALTDTMISKWLKLGCTVKGLVELLELPEKFKYRIHLRVKKLRSEDASIPRGRSGRTSQT